MRSLPAAAATLVCLLSSLAPLVSGQQATASTCQDVQIFIAVGHGESFPGNQRSIAQGVCKGRSSCAYSNIDYPSTDETKGYCVNSVTGINSGIKTVTAYVQKCPTSKVVLTGWSPGRAAGDGHDQRRRRIHRRTGVAPGYCQELRTGRHPGHGADVGAGWER